MNPKFTILIASLRPQEDTILETVPQLLPAVLYADKVIVKTICSDDLLELPGYCGTIEGALRGIVKHEWVENIEGTWHWPSSEEVVSAGKYAPPGEWFVENEDVEQILAHRLFDEVVDLVSLPHVYPILDDPGGLAASSMVPWSLSSRRAQGEVGTRLISGLPTFPLATPEEIVDIRSDLSKYLTPFRSSVLEMSRMMTVETEGLDDAIQDIIVGQVAPVLQGLKEETARNKYLSILTAEALSDPESFFRSFLAFGLGELLHMPTGLSVAAATASTLVSTAWKKEVRAQEIRKNKFYFLHALQKRLPRQ